MTVSVLLRMSPADSVHCPPLTTTDVREFVEGFGLECGLVRMEITDREVTTAPRQDPPW